jgi:hypothetical protein
VAGACSQATRSIVALSTARAALRYPRPLSRQGHRGGGPRLVHMPSEPSGSQRSPAVSSGRSFAQVAGAILGKQARGQNPDKDALLRIERSPSPAHGSPIGRRPRFVDGRGSRPSPAVGLGPELSLELHQAPDPGVVRTGYRARPWRRPRGGWPGRRRAAQRTGPAAPRSAVPGQGRAMSPPTQNIEQGFETPSTFLVWRAVATCCLAFEEHAGPLKDHAGPNRMFRY